jgi:hypothetical protein
MRKSTITILVACVGTCGAIALKPDQPADRPPPDPTSGLMVETPSEVLAITERAAKKEQLLDRLIVGDLRLDGAVETVIALNRDWPLLPPDLYEAYPGRSLNEQVAHMLIGAVSLSLAADNPRREEILCRLTGELGDIAATGGP